jgi:hypothetical protein
MLTAARCNTLDDGIKPRGFLAVIENRGVFCAMPLGPNEMFVFY